MICIFGWSFLLCIWTSYYEDSLIFIVWTSRKCKQNACKYINECGYLFMVHYCVVKRNCASFLDLHKIGFELYFIFGYQLFYPMIFKILLAFSMNFTGFFTDFLFIHYQTAKQNLDYKNISFCFSTWKYIWLIQLKWKYKSEKKKDHKVENIVRHRTVTLQTE